METPEFSPTGFSLKIFKDRYAFTQEESWQDACIRVASQIAIAETPEKQQCYREKFYKVLSSNLFVPGGRIWANAGRANPALLNCFVLDPNKDSKEGWGKSAYDMIVTSMTGGGCGDDFSDVRPRGSSIGTQRGVAPGAVELMRLVDACAQPVRNGGQRRVALMFSLDLDHPDIEEFLNAKLTKGELTHANVSVRSKHTKAFIKAVKDDGDWELHWKGKYKKIIKARTLWEQIVRNAYNSAEPGFLNWELVNQENPVYYCADMVTTNPCLVGNTLIAVADGRNAISIETLANEGKDVPLYSTNPNTGKVEIKMGRNPRKTTEKVEVWKLTLDDNSTVIATPNHKILTKELQYTELQNLRPGQSLFPFNSFSSGAHKYREIVNVGARMSGGRFRNRRQYRLIAEWSGFEVEPKTHAIHHKDFDSQNDAIENLEPMLHSKHMKLHSERMCGHNNPYHKMSMEWKNNFASHPGYKNGRVIDVTNEELISHGRKILAKHGRFTKNLWLTYARTHGIPGWVSNSFRFGSFGQFKNVVVGNHKVVSVERIGYEDVYNITVDDNHNYHVITSTEDSKYVTSSGICVKNCGEQPLNAFSSCCLGHIVLSRFVKDDQIDYPTLGDTIRLAVRFLDNTLSVNHFPLAEMKVVSDNIRRIGLGTTALADTLAMLGYRYGSDEGNKFIDHLYRFISKAAYEASILLAVEKGAFPLCHTEKHLESGFMKRMPAKTKSLVRDHGIRNCCILTQAPTGTVSILSENCSSGVEPMFASSYIRRYWDNEVRKEEIVMHPLFAKFMKEGKSVEHFVGAHDLTVRDHLEVQRIIQKHVDSAVSKTINIPVNYDMADMEKLWLEYLPHLKGTTFYRETTRGYINKKGEVEPPPLSPLTLEEAKKFYKKTHVIGAEHVSDCPTGICTI